MNFGNLKTHDRITQILLIICTLVFGYFIVQNANWTWGDDYEFLISTAVGKMEWDIHIANHGRLYPLGHSDFNILTLIPGGESPLAHYIVVFISFCLFVYLSYKLYKNILSNVDTGKKTISWIIFFALIFLFYYFYRLFFFLVYPERIMVVLFTLFFITYLKFLKTNKTFYAVIALLVSVYLSYTKETSFVIFSTIVGLNLLFNYASISKKQKIFYYALLLNVIVFLLVYYFVAYRTADTFYSRNSTLGEVILFTVSNLKILYIALILSLWRIYKFLIKNDRENIFIDSMLFSGILYGIANVVLKMPMDYYYYPAVMLSFPALLFWGVKFTRPYIILVLVILMSGYYVRKFPTVIHSVQNLRIETNQDITELAKLLNDSEDALWLQDSTIKTSNYGLMGYQREILGVYYDFYNSSTNSTEIRNLTILPDSMIKNTVLFYSVLNNINQVEYKKTLEKIHSHGFRKQELKNIHDIDVFIKE